MKNKFAILNHTIDHFTNSKYVDAQLKPFERDMEIVYIYLTSKTIDISKCTFKFNLNFDNWESRPFLSTDRLWPMFSNDLIKIIKKHYKELVCFPVTLIDKKGKEYVDKYSIVQIPHAEGLVNHELSVFERKKLFPHLFASVSKIVLNPNVKTNAIFRLQEYSQVMLINEELYKDLLEHNFTNLTLTDMDTYDWSYL